MPVCIFIRAKKVVNNKIVRGLLLYPTDFGTFRNSSDEKEFFDLFEGVPPPVPYAGVGGKFGHEQYAPADVQEAILEHMKKNFSLPKDLSTYWEKDKDIHSRLVFPASVVYGEEHNSESAVECSIRTVWEATGIKVDPEELKPLNQLRLPARKTVLKVTDNPDSIMHVYQVSVSIARAKWDWMSHQAERLTLTDWRECPYSGVLDELGVPTIVKTSYCSTHGGPRFISSMADIKDEYTKGILNELKINF